MQNNNSFKEYQVKTAGGTEVTIPVYQVTPWQGIPGLVHGFSTRGGGVSTGCCSSLNLGLQPEDPKENVQSNWGRLSQAVGVKESAWLRVNQIHSDRVVCITDVSGAEAVRKNPPDADGIICTVPGFIGAVKTADCVPVLLVSQKTRVWAVVHAGWKGTASGIVEKTAILIQKELNVPPDDIYAAVGPSIGPCCFQVGEDVAEKMPKYCVSSDISAQYIDLQKANEMQIKNAGINHNNIYISGLCTSCNPEIFFSYRRDGGKTGRMAAWAGYN